MELDTLSTLQMSALTEVGNIGAGHAATALSQLVDHRIDVSVPTLELMPVSDVPHLFGGPEKLVGAVRFRLLGDIAGSIVMLAGRTSCLTVVDLLRNRPTGSATVFGHDEEALMSHAASVLVSAYLAAIARMAGLNVLPSPASFALDMAGAILEAVTAEVSLESALAMMVQTRFSAEETHVDAVLLFIPDPASLQVLLQRLGV